MMSQIQVFVYIHCRLVTADQLPVLDVESKSSSAASQVLNVHYTVHVSYAYHHYPHTGFI